LIVAIDLTSDFQVLAATIDGEAEGEPLIGKQAVATSIMNRVKLANVHPHFGDGTIRGACTAHLQYDCWSPGPDYDRIMALDPANPTPAFAECLEVARQAIDGTLVDPTKNATYYYEPTIPGPPWLVGALWCGQFGSQLFWKAVK
jgi:N-acetylmuramoyl-L-alanine amidase